MEKSSLTSSKIYSDIKALDFRVSHKPYLRRHSKAYLIRPDNCLQWLHISTKDKIRALDTSKAGQVCQVCLVIPSQWNTARTTCLATLKERRRDEDRRPTCAVAGCPYHYTVCPTHLQQNKEHPLIIYPNRWLKSTLATSLSVTTASLTAHYMHWLCTVCHSSAMTGWN